MQKTLVNYNQNRKKYMTIRRNIYLFFIVFGLINIFFPFKANADFLGNEIQDLYAEITEIVQDTNGILEKAFELTQASPYDIINGISDTDQGKLAIAIRNATKSMALVVATILLMVEFVRKTVNFEWASKWENVLIFIVKILIMKQVVQNADVIISYIYAGFNTINEAITDTDITFLPCSDVTTYHEKVKQSEIQQMSKPWWKWLADKVTNDIYNDYYYDISLESVQMFYPEAELPASTEITDVALKNPKSGAAFYPTIESMKLQIYFLLMKAVAYIIFVITVGRVFELALYTMFAPLPLATFASDSSSDVAKNFIKSYVAVVIQVAVIATMFVAYVAVNKYIVDTYDTSKPLQYVMLFALGLAVIKSGSWSRKICGLS